MTSEFFWEALLYANKGSGTRMPLAENTFHASVTYSKPHPYLHIDSLSGFCFQSELKCKSDHVSLPLKALVISLWLSE